MIKQEDERIGQADITAASPKMASRPMSARPMREDERIGQRRLRSGLAALCALLFASHASMLSAAFSTPQVLRGGARSLGMGEAGAGALSGSEAMYWNPAGIKGEGRGELTAGHTNWSGVGLSSGTVDASLAVGEKGAFGFLGQMDFMGGLELRDKQGFLIGETRYSVGALKAAYAHELSPGFRVGASVGMASEDLAGYKKLGFGSEGGLRGRWGGFLMGLSGGLYPGGNSTVQGSLGYAASLGGGTLTLVGGAIVEAADSRAGIGAEHDLGPLSLRVGYEIPLGTLKTQGLSYITGGIGIRLKQMTLDYGFLPLSEFGQMHRAQVGYRFGK